MCFGFFFSLAQTEHWSRACISWLAPRCHSRFIITGPFSSRRAASWRATPKHIYAPVHCGHYNLAPLFLLCWLGSLQHYLLHRPPFFFYFSCHAHKGLNHRGFATHHANGCSGQTFHFITRLQVNMQLGIMASLPSLTNKNLHQKTFPSESTTHCFS